MVLKGQLPGHHSQKFESFCESWKQRPRNWDLHETLKAVWAPKTFSILTQQGPGHMPSQAHPASSISEASSARCGPYPGNSRKGRWLHIHWLVLRSFLEALVPYGLGAAYSSDSSVPCSLVRLGGSGVGAASSPFSLEHSSPAQRWKWRLECLLTALQSPLCPGCYPPPPPATAWHKAPLRAEPSSPRFPWRGQ